MKTETARKVTNLGRAGQRTLVYYVVEGQDGYGVGIAIEESREELFIGNITASRERAYRLADLLATNFVTPTTLYDVVYDWIS